MAEAPSAGPVEALRHNATDAALSSDECERRDEMLAGLDQLVRLAASPLPRLTTQHRVIGSEEICHVIVPVSLGAPDPTSGKLFLTDARVIIAAGRVRAWHWRRIRSIARDEYRVLVDVVGGDLPETIQCNTYGDALSVTHVARRLMQVSSGDARSARK